MTKEYFLNTLAIKGYDIGFGAKKILLLLILLINFRVGQDSFLYQ